MKKLQSIALVALICLTLNVNAQIQTPAPSPTATLSQTVGLVDFEVIYSRPGKKDREIFGKLVAYGEVWRTGANASTKIKFNEDVTLGGKEVEAGEYSIYTIPGESEWTIIISKSLENWGADKYTETEDAARFTVKPTKLTDVVETFTIDFSNLTKDGANLILSWDNVRVSFPVGVKTDEAVMAAIKKTIIDGPSANDYRKAALYYQEKGEDLEMALKWIDIAIEKRADAFWYIHNKAQILADLGKKKEAIEAAEKSMEMAKVYKDGDFGYIKRNEELIAKIKK
ncbi:MAG: DUF2911 domain-containing protein [Flavobacteriales bacterium]|nr:DUF2911 domain-containing protein [Flavobacteriales bacterium]